MCDTTTGVPYKKGLYDFDRVLTLYHQVTIYHVCSSFQPPARSFARLPAARTITTTPHLRAAQKPYFPNEPAAPQMATDVPGPNNKKATAELDEVFDVRSLNMLTDYTKSTGN